MMRLTAIFFVLLAPYAGFAQESRIAVYVSRAGQDGVGSLFETSLKQELARSTRYVPRHSEGAKTKFEFPMDLRTVDLADNKAEQDKRSGDSVVIKDFTLPDSYPAAAMCYHTDTVVYRK